MANSKNLSLPVLDENVRNGAGWATLFLLQPNAETPGGHIKPPTYAKAGVPYNVYERQVDGTSVKCVSLNSIGAEANCMEAAFQEAQVSGALTVPLPTLVFDPVVDGLEKMTTSEMGHRSADARLLFSEIDGVGYRESEVGDAILNSSVDDMTGILRWAPLDVVFGMWDSHDHTVTGKLRAKVKPWLKVARLITAEVHGIDITIRDAGAQLSDVANFSDDFPVKDNYGDDLFSELAVREGKKEAASAGFAQSPAYKENEGGVYMGHAIYEANLSAGLLRRYKFPTKDGQQIPERDHAARVLLASLGLLVQCVRFDRGFYLRSGCDLVPEDEPMFTFYGRSRKNVLFQGEVPTSTALDLFEKAVANAKDQGIEWGGETITATASKNFQKRLRAHLEWSGDKDTKKKSNGKKG